MGEFKIGETMINDITPAALKNNTLPTTGQAPSAPAPVSSPNNTPAQDTTLSPDSSLRIVNDETITAIDKELAASNATPIRNLNTENFTPESVANGILNFVQSAISRAQARGQSASELMTQARKGIEDGFKQATNILTSLNALSGQIASGVQQTYDLIHDGLQQIEIAQQNGTTVNFGGTRPNITAISQQMQSINRTFELNITTKDGDAVKISVSQSQFQQQFEASQAQGNTNTSFALSQSRTSERFEFTVIGSLDKAEISAVEAMLAKAKAASENFFNSDVSAAFEASISLGFNTKEIASFALNLNESQTQSTSRAYREINNFGAEGGRVSPSQLENLLKPVYPFMTEFQGNVKEAANSALFNNTSQNSVEGLFNYFSRANINNTAQIQRFESLNGNPFENITRELISSVL